MDSSSNSYKFEIINFQGFTFKTLKAEPIKAKSQIRDKILNVTSNRICIRNNEKLLFGSLKLFPMEQELLIKEAFNLNVHKYLIMNHYQFEFFTVETMFFLLKTNRKYSLFQFLLEVKSRLDVLKRQFEKTPGLVLEDPSMVQSRMNSINNIEYTEMFLRDTVVVGDMQRDISIANSYEPQKLVVNFNPKKIEKHINMNQMEFLATNKFETEVIFLQLMDEMREQLNESNTSSTLLATFDQANSVFHSLENEKGNFDDPARFIYLMYLEEKSNLKQPISFDSASKPFSGITSEIIVNAALSEQKDFIIQTLNSGKLVESWDEMFATGMIYWYENFGDIKAMIDRFWTRDYKENKDPWRILFWVILSGKPKVLSGLFKTQPDSHKFVQFFGEDFSLLVNQNKAVNNAFQLRSKKRFLDSAAFFILARKYRDGMEILIESLKNMQLAILVFKLFENEIKSNPQDYEYFKTIINEKFISDNRGFRDDYISIIGHFILGDNAEVVKLIQNYKSGDMPIRDLANFKSFYGFAPTSFSFSIDFLSDFLRKNGKYKAYLGELPPEEPTEINPTDEIDDMFSQAKNVFQKQDNYKNDIFAFDEEEDELEPEPEPKLISSIHQELKKSQSITAPTEIEDEKKLVARINYLGGNQKHFLVLLEMISLKMKKPSRFKDFCLENKHYIEHSIMEIIYKKLSKLIKRESFSKIEILKADIWSLCAYFGIDSNKIFKRIIERIKLISDGSLDLSILSCQKNETETEFFMEHLLQATIKKCFSIIKKGQFIFLDSQYWMKKLFFINNVVSILKLFSTLRMEDYIKNFVTTLSSFSEILNALFKLIMIRSMCFDETFELLGIKAELLVTCKTFGTLLETVGTKIKLIYPFSVRKYPDTDNENRRKSVIDMSEIGKNNPLNYKIKTTPENVRISELLHDTNPENEKKVRDLFLKMNQLEITQKINTIISDLGFADFYTPNNLCLQLLFEILYLTGFFFSADVSKSSYVSKIDFCFESIFFESLKNLVLLISYQDSDEAFQTISDLCSVLDNNDSFLVRNAFMNIQPNVALNMNFNKRFLTNATTNQRIKQVLEDLNIFLVFRKNLQSISEFQKKTRLANFMKGIQIFKPKLEPHNNIFSSKTFKKIVHCSTISSEEIYVLVQNRLRKVFLFTTLFKGKRADEYFSLNHPVG